MSDKANLLIDELVAACIAFGRQVEPDWQTRIDKAQRELREYIAELEEFKMIAEGCGFEVITEPPVLNHPERKILKGHGTIYVPELPEPLEVK